MENDEDYRESEIKRGRRESKMAAKITRQQYLFVQDICLKYEISGYPSIKFFKPYSSQEDLGILR